MPLDRSHLFDIIHAAEKIQHYVEGVAEDDFLQDELRSTTVIYQLIVIGEATKRLSSGLQRPKFPCSLAANCRNARYSGS
jgi:uncharacterized protein with HEPN domain